MFIHTVYFWLSDDAGAESRGGRVFTPNNVRNHGMYSGRVTNCHDPATHAKK